MDYSTHNALQRYYFFINGESIYLYFFQKNFHMYEKSLSLWLENYADK